MQPHARRGRHFVLLIVLIAILAALWQSWGQKSALAEDENSEVLRWAIGDGQPDSWMAVDSGLSMRADVPDDAGHGTPASDDKYSYENSVQVGKKFMCMMKDNEGSDPSLWTQSSPYNDYGQLTDYGWRMTSEEFQTVVQEDDGYTDEQGLLDAMGKLGVHPDGRDQDNHLLTWRHIRDSQPDPRGPKYLRTNGIYVNTFVPSKGAIFVQSAHGPRSEGRLQNPPVTGDPRAIVPLSRWSDVTWINWQTLCMLHRVSVQTLKAVVHLDVTNSHTKELISAALQMAGIARLSKFPGNTFNKDDDPNDIFASLLASPNALGTVWLLLQHRLELGYKEVSYIQVYCVWCRSEDEEVFMIVGIRPGTPSSSVSRRSENTENDIYKRAISNEGATDRNDQPLPWDVAVETGNYLIALINGPASCVEQSEWTDYSDLPEYGWTQTWSQEVDQPQSFVGMWSDMQLSTKGIKWTQWKHTRQSVIDQRVYRPTQAQYNNVYSREIIIAEASYGPDYQGKFEKPPVTGDEIIPLKQWSDVTFLEYQNYCAGLARTEDTTQQSCMRSLRGILRHRAVNEKTLEIGREALKKSGKPFNAWPGRATWKIHEPEAQALLATPNGRGIAWFLAQHKEQLGRKVVTEVSAFASVQGQYPSGINILFTVEDHPDAMQD